MHVKQVRILIFLLLVFLLQVDSFVIAQQNLTNVTGLIEDATGSVVVSASLTLEDASGRVVASTPPDSTGHFSFSHLPLGNYQLAGKDCLVEKISLRQWLKTTLSLTF